MLLTCAIASDMPEICHRYAWPLFFDRWRTVSQSLEKCVWSLAKRVRTYVLEVFFPHRRLPTESPQLLCTSQHTFLFAALHFPAWLWLPFSGQIEFLPTIPPRQILDLRLQAAAKATLTGNSRPG